MQQNVPSQSCCTRVNEHHEYAVYPHVVVARNDNIDMQYGDLNGKSHIERELSLDG